MYYGSGGIRTHASEETGALNQRLRPLGHATLTHDAKIFWILDENSVYCYQLSSMYFFNNSWHAYGAMA